MNKITCLLIASMAVAYAADRSEPFSRTIDDMTNTRLNSMSDDQVIKFLKAAEADKKDPRSPYNRSFGPNGQKGRYAQKFEETLNRAYTRLVLGSIDTDDNSKLPVIKRPWADKEVIDIFDVREDHLKGDEKKPNRDRLYGELNESRQSDSYRTQRGTNAAINKWADWLEKEDGQAYKFDPKDRVELRDRSPERSRSSDRTSTPERK
jgi:hypothetical protein